MMISIQQMVLQLPFDMAKWINSGNYDQVTKDTFAKMLAVFGIVFEEEVLDADIEALIEKRQEARANQRFCNSRCDS